jgi:hypothetical protein
MLDVYRHNNPSAVELCLHEKEKTHHLIKKKEKKRGKDKARRIITYTQTTKPHL